MTRPEEPVTVERARTTVGRAEPARDALPALVEALSAGTIDIVDLTQPLSERTPVIVLPEPFVNSPRWRLHELSRYDDRGPAWYWNSFEGGEHLGTHFDAPIHWVTGKDKDDVSKVPVTRLIGPAAVIDKTGDVARDPDYLLTRDDIEQFQQRHGSLPEGGWLLYRTGWDARAHDQAEFLNADDTGPHTPGFDVECARWLAEESPIVGVGVETVGTDAGGAHSFDPPFPCHNFLLGAGKYGVTQLANVSLLPPTGAVLVVAPLKIVGGSGSPCRVVALVPRT
jgi:kynurenine formamidase